MEEPSDATLILNSLANPGDFGGIFDRHAETLLRFLVRRVGPEEGAGLLGELFRIAFERREAFDRERISARPWLYGIASNLLMHQRRSETRRARATRRIESQAHAHGSTDATETVLVDWIDARLLLPHVSMALQQLPDAECETLLLFAWENQSYEEIADALEVPIGTVRSRIHRARSRLRELIGAAGKVLSEPPDSPAAREESR